MNYSAYYHVFPTTFHVISRKVDYLWDCDIFDSSSLLIEHNKSELMHSARKLGCFTNMHVRDEKEEVFSLDVLFSMVRIPLRKTFLSVRIMRVSKSSKFLGTERRG